MAVSFTWLTMLLVVHVPLMSLADGGLSIDVVVSAGGSQWYWRYGTVDSAVCCIIVDGGQLLTVSPAMLPVSASVLVSTMSADVIHA